MPKAKSKTKSPFEKARAIEAQYARDLRRIAREVGRIIDSFPPGDLASVPAMQEALRRYADIIKPWAEAKSTTMLASVDRQDERAWRKATEEMSQALRAELATAPTGEAFRQLQAEQVELITSLPLEAAERVHKLTLEGLGTSGRASEVKTEIMRSGEVAAARATCIARTEVARASSNLTQARAQWIGSDGYIWRTSKDSDVRPSHRKMENTYVPWSSPPTLDGMTGHAGCLPNCRCYPEPLIPDRFE